MRPHTTFLLTAALALGIASNPLAQPAGNSLRIQARGHALEGKRLEKLGKHDQAIARFKVAYSLVPHPAMFYNIAKNYRLKGDRAKALHYYDKYLTIIRTGILARRSEQAIADLRKEFAAAETKARRRAAEQERERKAALARKRKQQAAELVARERAERARRQRLREQARKLAEQQRNKATEHEPDQRDRDNAGPLVDGTSSTPGGNLRLTGLITGGLGIVGLAFGIKHGLDARSISDELSRQTSAPWTQAELDKQAEGESAQTKQIIFTSVGIAAIAGGVVMYVLGHNAARNAEQLSVNPVVTPDRVGWAVAGRF